MMVLRAVLVVSALYASTAYSDTTPSAALKDDLSQAKLTRSIAKELWTKNQDACVTRDTSALADVMRSANTRLRDRTGYSAFPACLQMLTDITYINGGCYTGKLSQDELNHSRNNWEKDSAECDAQIANPSADSLKEQSDAEWEAEQRKGGASDSDIQMMKTLRRL
ncbi:hypothetical protein NUV89_02910 [Pseudomonas sp. 18.1.10]|uniref:hypothetical protein n=1 Tax=Pseudomonas sp. 18.1.10 TaxID=2969302 RepID=UPI00214FE8E6|nr:hypothetical protein [Pseudomonas sp. 18.1.10]MCR4537339.1 hypothetical protein [Pseudomonas sp. 18.1.10]